MVGSTMEASMAPPPMPPGSTMVVQGTVGCFLIKASSQWSMYLQIYPLANFVHNLMGLKARMIGVLGVIL